MNIFNRNKIKDDSFTEIDEIFSHRVKSVNIIPRFGFKEALFARLKSARQTVSMSKFSLQNFLPFLKGEGRSGLMPVALTVLVVAIIATVIFQPFFGVKTVYAQDNFSLTAEAIDSLGVGADSSFLLESKEAIDENFVKENLIVNTDIDYSLKQISSKQIRIAFADPLPVSKVVTFSLNSEVVSATDEKVERPYSWAFQVKSPFRVVGTLPGNHETNWTPVDTGIEISFNYENIKLKDFEKSIIIFPGVKGHIEQFRKTFVFVPEEKLKEKTVYTITVLGQLGLKGSKEILGEDYVFSFETGADNGSGRSFWLEEKNIITTPNEAVALIYSAWNNDNIDGIDDSAIGVEVHQFVSTANLSDYQQYLTAYQKIHDSSWLNFVTAESVADLANLPIIASFDAEKIKSNSRDYLLFPTLLSRGYYLAVFSFGDQKQFALIESSQVTAYAAKAVNETLVWVNSAETKKPLVDASVKFIDFEETSQTTNENGLVHLLVPNGLSAEDYAKRDLLEIRFGSEAIILPLDASGRVYYDGKSDGNFYRGVNGLSQTPLVSSAEASWSYLYTDRPMYQLNDTLKFWGYVENRENGQKPKTVRVIISESGWCSPFGCEMSDNNRLVFDETVVEVSKTGTFTGELKLEDVPAGYYQVEVLVGEETLVSRGVAVSEYIKPAFSLSIETDQDAIFAGDNLGFTVHGEFFDGTPVNGLPVIIEADSASPRTQELVLDSAGNVRGNLVFSYHEDRDYPTSVWLGVSPARSEEADIQTSTSVAVFGPKVFLQENWNNSSIKNNLGTVKLTARNVQTINSFEPEIFAPTVKPNQLVNGELYEITYNKIETGTSYDFIRKQTIPLYRYERVEKKLNDFSLTTDVNGEAVYTFPANNSEANYRVVLRAVDENGRVNKLDTYVWRKESYETGGGNQLQFKNLDIPEGKDNWDFPGYKIKDTVHLQAFFEDSPLSLEENSRLLYFQAQQGIGQISVLKDNTYSFTFDQNSVPNLSVYGVYFDGRGYAQISNSEWSGGYGFNIAYDNSEKELKVEVAPEKDTYRPGEEVKLKVAVTDKADKPFSAEVNLNIVDEAFYALMYESVNPLAEIYKNVSDGIISTKVSLNLKQFQTTMAEGGGGGDRGRSVFKDTADFVVVETDQNGQAVYSFKLPDNITSWRVTAQALNPEEKMAGQTKINLQASLPFFVVPIIRENYLVKDQPQILIRCAGNKVGLNDSVEYTISVPDAGIEKKEFSTAAETIAFSLPQLSEGKHEIIITGSANGLTDTVTRSVKIIPSYLVKPVVSLVTLAGQEKISGSENGLTKITFVDGGAGQYYSELQSLINDFGDRADEKMAKFVATKILNEKFGENNPEPELSVSSYQDGLGVKLLPYGGEDFDLSVKVAMAGGLPFSQSNLITYFGNTFYASRQAGQEISTEEVAKSYAALAALGEPVLAEVQRLLTEKDLVTNEKLYLSLALHFSGDDEGARIIYRELIKKTTKEFGYVYLSADDVETQGEQTALLAVLAAALRENDRDALHDYVTNQYHGNTLLVLEQSLFIKEAVKALKDSETKVAYTLEGERRELTFKNNETITLALSPNELSDLNPEVKQGTAVVVSRFDLPLVNDDSVINEKLGLTRFYSTVDGSVEKPFKAGDLVKVEVKFQVPLIKNISSDSPDTNVYEDFEITDVLPAGLALVTPAGGWWIGGQDRCVNYPAVVKGQRVTFYVNNFESDISSMCSPYTLTYFARVVTPGTYIAEPAYIRSMRDLNDVNHSDEITMTISK